MLFRSIVSGMSPLNELDRSTLMEFHNLPPKCQKRNVLCESLRNLSINICHKISIRTLARHLFGSLRQSAHTIHKRISILCSLRMRMVRSQTLQISCPQKIPSSTHIVDSWQLQALSHNTFALNEQIREENSSTI